MRSGDIHSLKYFFGESFLDLKHFSDSMLTGSLNQTSMTTQAAKFKELRERTQAIAIVQRDSFLMRSVVLLAFLEWTKKKSVKTDCLIRPDLPG